MLSIAHAILFTLWASASFDLHTHTHELIGQKFCMLHTYNTTKHYAQPANVACHGHRLDYFHFHIWLDEI